MKDLRTAKTRREYIKVIKGGHLKDKCPMCDESIIVKEFTHWKVVRNRFPYDLIADVNDLLITKRHTTFEDLNYEEREEYALIKKTFIEKNYHIILESLANGRSIPSHFHVNLIVYKGRPVPQQSISKLIEGGLYT